MLCLSLRQLATSEAATTQSDFYDKALWVVRCENGEAAPALEELGSFCLMS